MKLFLIAVVLLNTISSMALNLCQSEENSKNEAATMIGERTRSLNNALNSYTRVKANYESTVHIQNEFNNIVELQNNFVGYLGEGLKKLETLIKVIGNGQSNALQILSDLSLAFSSQQHLIDILKSIISENESINSSGNNIQLLEIYNELTRYTESFQQIRNSYLYINNVLQLGSSSLDSQYIIDIFSGILKGQNSLELASAEVLQEVQKVNAQYEQALKSQVENVNSFKDQYESAKTSLESANSTYNKAKKAHKECKDKVEKAAKLIIFGGWF